MADRSGNPSRNRPRRLVLVGFMGAGKTSVGRELAKFLKCDFIDLDDRIEAAEQRAVHEIFAREGEAYFRSIERDELERVLREVNRDLVLSVGGGAFTQPGTAEMLHDAGVTSVLLDAKVEELRRRVSVGNHVRPLAQDAKRFATLYAQRSEAYARAQQRFDTTGKSVARVAHEIADWVNKELPVERS